MYNLRSRPLRINLSVRQYVCTCPVRKFGRFKSFWFITSNWGWKEMKQFKTHKADQAWSETLQLSKSLSISFFLSIHQSTYLYIYHYFVFVCVCVCEIPYQSSLLSVSIYVSIINLKIPKFKITYKFSARAKIFLFGFIEKLFYVLNSVIM